MSGCWTTPLAGIDSSQTDVVEKPGIPEHSFVSSGPPPNEFHEAHSLAEKVAAGELPPVRERVSDEPLVIAPLETVGQYGGTWRRAFTGPGDAQNVIRIQHDQLIYYDLDGQTVVPHIAKSWEVSQDGRAFTFHLRSGMKWSDGEPFTVDDFMFAYQDVVLRDDLCPSKPTWLITKSGMGQIEKVDVLTFRISFADPNYVFPELCAGLAVAGQWARAHLNSAMFLPRHYLRNYHAKYRNQEELEREAREAGFDSWVAYFREKAQPHRNAAVPTVGPWITTKPITQEQFVLDRNPYYWAVDPEGNQLPYIDRIVMRLAADPEVLNLRAIAGEIDMQQRHIQLAKVPVLFDNAEKGDYRVFLWPDLGGNDCCVFFNQNYDTDPEIASLLQAVEFRRALSLAIDREAIDELVFLGEGQVRAFLPPDNTPYYPGKEYELTDVKLDLDKANALLDGLNLTERDSEGFRLRRDNGKRLIVTLEVTSNALLDYRGIAELLERHWAKVGVGVHILLQDGTLYNERVRGNQTQITLWNPGGSENIWVYPYALVPYFSNTQWAPATGEWYTSNGQAGKPPTPTMQRLLELFALGSTLPLKKRIPVGQEIWRIHCEQLFAVGLVGLSPAVNGVVVVKNNFRNVPEVAPNSPPLQNPGIARPETFFFKQR